MYLPTPEEIQAECQAIQAGWSRRERASRETRYYRPARTHVVHTGRLPRDVQYCLLSEPRPCQRTE
jgi:hypothetical protein